MQIHSIVWPAFGYDFRHQLLLVYSRRRQAPSMNLERTNLAAKAELAVDANQSPIPN
jgi:hypothetical protein